MTPERVLGVGPIRSASPMNPLGASDVAEPTHVFVLNHVMPLTIALLPA
jgi:hypothetical protein